MGHSDPIEAAIFRHEEGNEGEKNGVKRGIGGFYGGKLLKRWEQLSALSFQPFSSLVSGARLLFVCDL
jgi:hypothetical protein